MVWTEARRRGFTLADVVRWMAEGPARLVGLEGKGRIAPGSDADFCVLAPDDTFVVDPGRLHHKHPITPYSGHTLAGVRPRTWLRGKRDRRPATRPACSPEKEPDMGDDDFTRRRRPPGGWGGA